MYQEISNQCLFKCLIKVKEKFPEQSVTILKFAFFIKPYAFKKNKRLFNILQCKQFLAKCSNAIDEHLCAFQTYKNVAHLIKMNDSFLSRLFYLRFFLNTIVHFDTLFDCIFIFPRISFICFKSRMNSHTNTYPLDMRLI